MTYELVTDPSGMYQTIVTKDHGRRENILKNYDLGGYPTPVFRNDSMARQIHKYLSQGRANVLKATHLHTPSEKKAMTVDEVGRMVEARVCQECHHIFPCKTRLLLDDC